MATLDPVYLRAAALGDADALSGLAAALVTEAAHAAAANEAVARDLLAQAEAYAVLGTQNGTDRHHAILASIWFARAEAIEMAGDPVRALHFRSLAKETFAALAMSDDESALATMALTYAAHLRGTEDAEVAADLSSVIGRLPAETAISLREYERTWPKPDVRPISDAISEKGQA